MKKIVYIILLLIVNPIFSYKDRRHPIVTEAVLSVYDSYYFLDNDYQELLENAGQEEDWVDQVYCYFMPGWGHYWNQDKNFPYGEGLIGLEDFPGYNSAWDKATCYYYGWDICGIQTEEMQSRAEQNIFNMYETIPLDHYLGFIWRAGRILHLLEDMSVPAHVHNDAHAGGIPFGGGDDEYEVNWVGKYVYDDYSAGNSLGLWHIDDRLFRSYITQTEKWEEEISEEDYRTGNYTLDCGEDCRCYIKLVPLNWRPDNPKQGTLPYSGPIQFKILKICERKTITGINYETVTGQSPLLEIFSKMNQMADYFPSDDVVGDDAYFDYLTWNWPKLYINDIIYYTWTGEDGFKAEGMQKVSDALMPRVIEAGATLLYYFAQETWERFGEDGIHFIDAGGTDRGNKVIWFSNLGGPGQIVDIALSSYQVNIGAISKNMTTNQEVV